MGSPVLDRKETAQTIEEHIRAIAHAVAQQELEGLKVSVATLEDMHRAARGEISDGEVIAKIYERFERA